MGHRLALRAGLVLTTAVPMHKSARPLLQAVYHGSACRWTRGAGWRWCASVPALWRILRWAQPSEAVGSLEHQRGTPRVTVRLLAPLARSWALCGSLVPSSGAGTGARGRWTPRRGGSRVAPPPPADNPGPRVRCDRTQKYS